jgi:hypothetical protein
VPENSGRTTLVGAVIVGVCVVVGSAIVASALNGVTTQLDRTTQRLEEIKTAMADAQKALANVARAPAAAPTPQRRRGPDPDKRYDINIAGSPAKGVQTAKVKIVEFSDFQ